MRRIAALLAAAALTGPALAQHQDHSAHQDPAEPEDHSAHEGHAAHQEHAAPDQPDPHPGHQPTGDPHAGHAAPDQLDPHAGDQPAADPHAGHAMPAAPAAAPPHTPPGPGAFAGPAHAADLVWGEAAMARAREELRVEHGAMTASKLLVDRLEARIRDGEDGYLWDAQFWWGGDIDKIWLKTEGEGAFGETVEEAEIQALWSHAIDPWFDVQFGLRHDFRPDPERTHLVLGVQGLAPYWFEVDGALFLSNEGDLTVRFEGEYDLRITQPLIIQPRLEAELAAQDVPELGIGAGLSSLEGGLRLRYEIVPEFAPYVGVEYERAFGRTADFARAAGEDAGGWSLLLGVRTWF